MTYWMMLGLGLLAALNTYATAKVIRADAFSAKQRSLQAALIWMMPILGAVIALAFLAADRPSTHLLSNHAPYPGTDYDTLPEKAPAICGCATPAGGDD